MRMPFCVLATSSISTFIMVTYLFVILIFFFFFKDPAPTEISPLPLHDALPIYGDEPLPLRAAARRRHQLHAQQREGRDRRLRRHRHGLSGRPARPAGANPGEGVPRDLPAEIGRAHV